MVSIAPEVGVEEEVAHLFRSDERVPPCVGLYPLLRHTAGRIML